MAIFDQITTELETYPQTYVVLEIIDVGIPGDVLNVNDIASFKIRVINNGPLHLTGVTLRVSGQNGAKVRAGVGAEWVSSYISPELPMINAHNAGDPYELGLPYFLAPATTQDSKTLVKVTLEDWNANWDHILIGHSDPHRDEPKGTYADAVDPQ